jgi:hypothetical protein
MAEWWSTRWYTPLLALGALLLALLVAGIAAMEMFASEGPSAVALEGWTESLDRIEAALAGGDATAALSAWREANAAALRTGQWEGMIAVGDAARRLGAQYGVPREYLGRARQAYLTALYRARRDHSVDGVLRAAAAFADLGDREVLAQALGIAAQQAGRDPVKRARVRATAEHWTNPSPTLQNDRRDPFFSNGGYQP